MADILSEGTKPKQRQVIHSMTARSFDEGQGKVATGAANLTKFPRSVLDGVADFRIAWDHAARYGQRNLENGRSRYIGTCQFVYISSPSGSAPTPKRSSDWIP